MNNINNLKPPELLHNHIQTLRAFSVLIVFLYHTNIDFFSYGYLGVDIFFLISGYVISKKIFDDYNENKKIDLKKFYIKRIKRILPNLLFIVSITYIFYLIFGPPDLSLFKETIFAFLGISNLYYINYSRDYFNNVFEDPLGHTWSLGVEEQFYLIFPLLIFIFLRKKNNFLYLVIILTIIFIFSLLLFLINFKSNPLYSFYFSPFRFWEFLMGTFFYFLRNKIKYNKYIFFISIFLIFFVIFNNNGSYLNIYKNVIILILSGYLITAYKKNFIFENKIFIFIGNISYSFYLWHLPVLFFSDLYITSALFLDLFFALILTLILSVITYKLVEQKLRYSNWKFSYVISIFIIGFFLFFSLMYIKYFNDRLRDKIRNFVYNLNYLEKNYNWNDRIIFTKKLRINGFEVYNHCLEGSTDFKLNDIGLRSECLKNKNFKKLYFIFGDSHSAQFLPLLINNEDIENIYYLHLNNHPFPDKNIVNKTIKYFQEVYFLTNISNQDNFNKVISTYEDFKSKNTKLIVFNSTPHVVRNEPYKCLIQDKTCFVSRDKNIRERKLTNLFKSLLKYKEKNVDNFFVFNSFDLLCKTNKCMIYDDKHDTLIFRDDTHLTYEGANTLLSHFREFLRLKDLN